MGRKKEVNDNQMLFEEIVGSYVKSNLLEKK